jgi:hypothetical protein
VRRDGRATVAARCRAASLILLSLGATAVVALHVLRRDLAPGRHRISEYALGPYGWVMALAFACVGAGVLVLGVAVSRVGGRACRPVACALGVAGVGLLASGVWRTDASRAGATSDAIHSAASAGATLTLVGAAVAWSALHPTGRRRSRDGAAWATLVVVALAAVSPALHRTSWTGSSQRLLWIAVLTWLMLVAWRLMPAAGHDVSGPSGPVRTMTA